MISGFSHKISYSILFAIITLLGIGFAYYKKENEENILLLERSLSSIENENQSLFELLKEINDNPIYFERAIKRISIVDSLYYAGKESLFEIDSTIHKHYIKERKSSIVKSMQHELGIRDSLINIASTMCIVSLKYDSKYLDFFPLHKPYYNQGDTVQYSIRLITNWYILPNTWQIVGCSEKNITAYDKYLIWKIPTKGVLKNEETKKKISKMLSLYLKNNYTKTRDTLYFTAEFYVLK